MAKVGLFYGSTNGNTAEGAEEIQKALGGSSVVELFDISDVEVADMMKYDYLIIGSSTWNTGELQDDWDEKFDDLDALDFSGKTVAYFGYGDQIGYADNFIDAVGKLEEKITGCGGKTVGMWPTDGYEHDDSLALRNGKFCGLPLDEDNQSDKTEERIAAWTTQIKTAMSL